jgi:3-mercaptopyruvate sulfurtransferase SseA
MSALGVADNATIVVYEQEGVFSAPRAWWTLRTFGAQNVYILDGGLRAWTEANLPTESGLVQPVPPPASTPRSTAPRSKTSLSSKKKSPATSKSSTPALPPVSTAPHPSHAPA